MLASASIKCFIPGRLPSLRIRRIGITRLSRTSVGVAGDCPASAFRGGSRGLGRDEERRNDATERPAWKGTGRDETKGKRSPHLLRIATTRAR